MSGHLVLLGDSIFDNASYVPGGPSVIEHLRRALPPPWRATLLAVDGAVVSSVLRQLERLPGDTTHIILSVGGNNALGAAGGLFSQPVGTVRQALAELSIVRDEFTAQYRDLLNRLRELGKALAVCTIYDSIPGLSGAELAGLCAFNDTITRCAFAAGATLIDLRLLCQEKTDYSPLSPIEPSASGGSKIARAIAAVPLGDQPMSQVMA